MAGKRATSTCAGRYHTTQHSRLSRKTVNNKPERGIRTVCYRSEGDIVVETTVVAPHAAAAIILVGRRLLWCRLTRCGRRRLVKMILAAVGLIVVVAAATAAIATTTQHLHVAHHYFGSVTILPVLSLPLAGSQAAFHIHLATLFQILTGNFGKLVEKH